MAPYISCFFAHVSCYKSKRWRDERKTLPDTMRKQAPIITQLAENEAYNDLSPARREKQFVKSF